MSADTAALARHREDRVAWLVFVTLLIMAVLMGGAMLIEEQPYRDVIEEDAPRRIYEGHGVPHPEFKPLMRRGGDGRERHAGIVLIAWAFAMLSVVFGTTCCYLGSLRRAGPSPVKWLMIGAAVVGGITFSAMFATYWSTLGDTAPYYFLGFPVATAWMMFGVSAFPVLIVGIYVATFDSWFAPSDINDQLEQICRLAQCPQGEEA